MDIVILLINTNSYKSSSHSKEQLISVLSGFHKLVPGKATPDYIRSHSWQCMSEQKPSPEVKGIVHRVPRQDCVEAQIWGRVPKNVCSIEGPQEHSGLIPKWKKFGTTKTLPRPGRLAKLNNQGKRTLVREVHPMDRVPLWRWKNLPEGQQSL